MNVESRPASRRILAGAVLSAILAVPAGGALQQSSEPATPPELVVEVLEDAWQVGDEKTYTLMFDRAPLGTQAMRLVALRRLPDDDREAVFQQRISLDLRALGQEGSLEHSGTIRYLLSGPGPYRYREGILEENAYGTYRKGKSYRRLLEVELDPVAGTYRTTERGAGDGKEGTLPGSARTLLLDLMVLGHWERVFEARARWPVGQSLPQPVVIPTPLPRLDFHLEVDGPRPVTPRATTLQITVEAKEEIDLFGARLQAFRCRIEPTGMTLWVSPHGGVLRFDDGRGLTGALEP
jgi:hypothetical protein